MKIYFDAGAQGKILQKTDIGNYSYNAQKIHQLKYLTPISGGADPATIIGANTRDITYTPFLKTQSITEDGYELTYTYGSDRQRLTSTLKQNGSVIESKIYWGNMEVVTKGGVTSEIYYIAGPAGLTNIIVKKNGVIDIYNAYTDQLGSILAVTTGSGGVVAEQNFDAWGRNRNPNDWGYSNVPVNPDWLFRGYTGHEHVTAFRLINMNGRMYDPMTGLMLSPDNYVPMPWSPGGYNRYGYANGNPLKYVDPDGEFFWLAIPIFAGINLVGDLIRNDFKMSLGQIGLSLLKGAAQGALAGAGGPIGGGITTWQSAVVSAASSQLPGVSFQVGDMSLSLSPAVMFGSTGWSAGANFSAGVSTGNFDFGLSLGYGYGKSNITGIKGSTIRIGALAGGNIGDFRFGLTSNQFLSGETSQTIGGGYLGIGDFNAQYENDWFFGVPNADNGDRYRTTGFRASYKDFSIGLNLFTGAPELDDKGNRQVIPGMKQYLESGKQYRLGALYVGYKQYELGVNSELIRNYFQNHLVHKDGNKYPIFQVINRTIYPFFNYRDKNQYTTW